MRTHMNEVDYLSNATLEVKYGDRAVHFHKALCSEDIYLQEIRMKIYCGRMNLDASVADFLVATGVFSG